MPKAKMLIHFIDDVRAAIMQNNMSAGSQKESIDLR
jgi:hypothetical protein